MLKAGTMVKEYFGSCACSTLFNHHHEQLLLSSVTRNIVTRYNCLNLICFSRNQFVKHCFSALSPLRTPIAMAKSNFILALISSESLHSCFWGFVR